MKKISLEEFNNKFKYKSDKNKFGHVEVWEVPKESPDGLIYCDCESYILKLKYDVNGFSNIKPYYCEVNGNGHLVGKIYDKWIDCNTRTPVENLPISYDNFRKVSKIDVFLRMLSTKLFGKVVWIN